MNRARLVYWLNEITGDAWLDEPWTNKILTLKTQEKISELIAIWFADPMAKVVCKYWGHVPTKDHCGMPKHDYCLGCNTPMPGQAEHGAHF